MITNFYKYNLINESPDTCYEIIGINKNGSQKIIKHGVKSRDAISFLFKINPDTSQLVDVYVSKDIHTKINYDCKPNERAYPGRLWINSKLIALWTYPSPETFSIMINMLEKKLNTKINNNGWRIEIIKSKNNKINYDADLYFRSDEQGTETIIPIEDYSGSKNQPEEKKLWHLMRWDEKQRALNKSAQLQKKGMNREKADEIAGVIRARGWGSDITAWDSKNPLWWRQLKYQENKNYDNKI